MPIYTGDKFGFGKAPDDGGDTSIKSGEAFFPEPGQFDWICPDDVTEVSAVCVGGGGGAIRDEIGGGGGGGLGWKNNIPVIPGTTYKIQVGAGGVGDTEPGSYGCRGGDSWFIDSTTVQGQGGGGTGCSANGAQNIPGYGGRGGVYTGDGGGNGGNGGDGNRSNLNGSGQDTGGGGAGGYTGDGGQGGSYGGNWNTGTAGNGGGGGGAATNAGGSTEYWGGGGGGVSVYGKGRNGETGSTHQHDNQSGGTGGSGGAAGWGNGGNASGVAQVNGGQYGGGGGSTDSHGGYGGSGAVRIIWGTGRAFPSTGADDFWSETITRYTAPTAGDPTTTSSNWFRGGCGNQTGYGSNYNDNGIVPNITAHDNLNGAFTWECWIYCERLADNSMTFTDSWGSIIMSGRPHQTDNGQHFGSISLKSNGTQGTGPYRIYYHINGTNYLETDYIIPQCTWTHVALTRNFSNEWWMWVDGKRAVTTPWTGTNSTATLQAYSGRPVIGGWGYGGRMQVSSWFGNISNLRITKGIALYDDANTTYTIPTFPLTTTIGGGGGTSSNSVHFSNGNDYLTVGGDTTMQMGTDDFTIECWAKFDDTSNRGLWQIEGLTTNHSVTLSFAHNGSVWHGYRGGSTWNFGSSRNTNQWYHCAYVRHSGTCYIYVDGTSIGSWSDSYNYQGTTLAIGGYYTTSYLMNGNISNFRMVKGQALYTGNFTPPTGPLTTTSQGATASNVKLLCCNKSTPTGKDVGPTISNGQGSPAASSEHPFGSSPEVTTLCCGVDDDYEKDLVNTRVWSGPNCMPSVLGPGEPTAEVMQKGYRIWGRYRGLGGGTKTGQNGDPGDGGLLSTWKKSSGAPMTEQFATRGGWSAQASTADGVAIKVNPNGAYLTGNNAGATWSLKSISYGVPTSRPRNSAVGMGPFIENVQIRVMEGKNSGDTVLYDSGTFRLRLPSYNEWQDSNKNMYHENDTSCAFEIELPNGGISNLAMDTWYSVYLKGMAHPNSNNWNSTNGSPGSGNQSYWYPSSPVSYSNSGTVNIMRYAPKSDADEIEITCEQANFNDTSWASANHGDLSTGQMPFFGISMPINFMKDPLPVPGAAPAGEKVFHASCWNTQETYTWTVPAGVTSICVICVGGGGAGETQHDGASGGGGGLAYKNDITVTPGETVTVRVGAGGFATSNGVTAAPDGQDSEIQIGPTRYAVAGGGAGGNGNMGNEWLDNSGSFPDIGSDGGGHGGCGVHHSGCRQSGGGAGGYNGGGQTTSGYAAGNYSVSNTNAAGQGGGGGGGYSQNGSSSWYSAGGGGTGIYGQGSDGNYGDRTGSPSDWKSYCGKGGSTAHNTGLSGYSVASPQTTYWGTATGVSCPAGQSQYLREQYLANYHGSNHATPDGGFPGGGGGGSNSGSSAGWGGNGVVRIIWGTANGIIRAFPSTGVDKSDQYPNGTVETPEGTQRQY